MQIARERLINVIAITDHDTTGGMTQAEQAALGAPVVIPGIELSAESDGHNIHMLGYFLNVSDTAFQARLTELRQDREERAREMVRKLAALNMPLDWTDILRLAAGGAIGRPHIARALIERGYVRGAHEAFERYIGSGGPAYVPRAPVSPEDAIELIHSAGGVAVMAHPGLVPGYMEMVERLVPAGLDGVETAHPKNIKEVQRNLRVLARRYNLIMTGGSDFHAEEADGTFSMGTVKPPEGCVDQLRVRAERYVRTNPG